MKKWRFLLICLLGALQLTAFAAPKENKPKEKPQKEKKVKPEKPEKPIHVFMYGAATNFNDSIVYITDVQRLDSMIIKSDGSLQNLAYYSQQLKVYLEGTLGEIHQTCSIIYSNKRRKVESKLSKMRYKYQSSKDKTLKKISSDEFTFKRIVTK